jgi:c-di-GMP-binding flagellar brake protein YcgR
MAHCEISASKSQRETETAEISGQTSFNFTKIEGSEKRAVRSYIFILEQRSCAPTQELGPL